VTLDDVAAELAASPRSSATITDLVGKIDPDKPPRDFEADNRQVAQRYATDDPRFPPQVMGAANDFRVIDRQPDDVRYAKLLSDATGWNGQLTLDRLWQVAGDVEMNNQGEWKGAITAHTMIFLPDLMRIGVAYSDKEQQAPEKSPVWFDWAQLFGDDDDNDDNDTVDDDASPDDDDDASPGGGNHVRKGGCGC